MPVASESSIEGVRSAKTIARM